MQLASIDIGAGGHGQFVAHGDPEEDILTVIAKAVAEMRTTAEKAGVTIPLGAYAYMFGKRPDGVRYLVSSRSRVNR